MHKNHNNRFRSSSKSSSKRGSSQQQKRTSPRLERITGVKLFTKGIKVEKFNSAYLRRIYKTHEPTRTQVEVSRRVERRALKRRVVQRVSKTPSISPDSSLVNSTGRRTLTVEIRRQPIQEAPRQLEETPEGSSSNRDTLPAQKVSKYVVSSQNFGRRGSLKKEGKPKDLIRIEGDREGSWRKSQGWSKNGFVDEKKHFHDFLPAVKKMAKKFNQSPLFSGLGTKVFKEAARNPQKPHQKGNHLQVPGRDVKRKLSLGEQELAVSETINPSELRKEMGKVEIKSRNGESSHGDLLSEKNSTRPRSNSNHGAAGTWTRKKTQTQKVYLTPVKDSSRKSNLLKNNISPRLAALREFEKQNKSKVKIPSESNVSETSRIFRSRIGSEIIPQPVFPTPSFNNLSVMDENLPDRNLGFKGSREMSYIRLILKKLLNLQKYPNIHTTASSGSHSTKTQDSTKQLTRIHRDIQKIRKMRPNDIQNYLRVLYTKMEHELQDMKTDNEKVEEEITMAGYPVHKSKISQNGKNEVNYHLWRNRAKTEKIEDQRLELYLNLIERNTTLEAKLKKVKAEERRLEYDVMKLTEIKKIREENEEMNKLDMLRIKLENESVEKLDEAIFREDFAPETEEGDNGDLIHVIDAHNQDIMIEHSPSSYDATYLDYTKSENPEYPQVNPSQVGLQSLEGHGAGVGSGRLSPIFMPGGHYHQLEYIPHEFDVNGFGDFEGPQIGAGVADDNQNSRHGQDQLGGLVDNEGTVMIGYDSMPPFYEGDQVAGHQIQPQEGVDYLGEEGYHQGEVPNGMEIVNLSLTELHSQTKIQDATAELEFTKSDNSRLDSNESATASSGKIDVVDEYRYSPREILDPPPKPPKNHNPEEEVIKIEGEPAKNQTEEGFTGESSDAETKPKSTVDPRTYDYTPHQFTNRGDNRYPAAKAIRNLPDPPPVDLKLAKNKNPKKKTKRKKRKQKSKKRRKQSLSNTSNASQSSKGSKSYKSSARTLRECLQKGYPSLRDSSRRRESIGKTPREDIHQSLQTLKTMQKKNFASKISVKEVKSKMERRLKSYSNSINKLKKICKDYSMLSGGQGFDEDELKFLAKKNSECKELVESISKGKQTIKSYLGISGEGETTAGGASKTDFGQFGSKKSGLRAMPIPGLGLGFPEPKEESKCQNVSNSNFFCI